MASESVFIHIIISLSILLFSAKIFAEMFQRINQPVVLGELLAGIIVDPDALGGLPLFGGEPLVVLDETRQIYWRISGHHNLVYCGT